MKKIILLIFLAVLTTSSTTTVANAGHATVEMQTYVINNMTYGVFYSVYSGGGTSASPCVINITKDQLECQYYRKQLKR